MNGNRQPISTGRKRGWKFYVHNHEINVCPVCGEILSVIGTRQRKVINSTGEKQTLIIRRMRCKGCRVIHHELPDIVIPYKRHCADTVEKIVTGADKSEEFVCEESTIRRIKTWWGACTLYFESILASLREKYGVVFSWERVPREIVRAVANAHLWVHTRSAFMSG